MDVTLWGELILFVILMGMSGFFSSSETSLFSLSKLQLEQMRRDENPRITLIERLLSEPRRLIVTILIGNEFVNVAGSVISAAVIIDLYGPDSKYINLFVMIPILLLVGEITPKTLAIKNNVAFATYQSTAIDKFAWFITPIRTVVRLVADKLITLILGKERSRGNIVTQDMVRTLAQEAVGDGVLHKDEAEYIDNIFEFGTNTVNEVMTPRSNFFFLRNDMPLEEILKEVRRTRHTKIPVYGTDREEVLGVLYARDLLAQDLSQVATDPESFQSQLREPFLVPETKPIVELFRTFRKRRISLALTVDEYGGVTGLVTLEDLLECIFGELPSASEDRFSGELSKRIQASENLRASMTIEQFNTELDAELPMEAANTLGGLILHEYGELPPEGAKISSYGWELTVVSVEKHRIQEIRAKKLEALATSAKSSDADSPSEARQPTPKEENSAGATADADPADVGPDPSGTAETTKKGGA